MLKRARSFAQSISSSINAAAIAGFVAPVETQTRKLFAQPSPFLGWL